MQFVTDLAIIDAGVIAVFIPITALMIPIVAILVKHQQRMAEIIHGSGGGQEIRGEVNQLRGEVYELKQMLHQQMIAMDSLMTPPPITRTPSVEQLQQRLEQTK